MCSGPVGRAEVFDRAIVGQTRFTCTRLEGSKKAKDSLVLLMHNNELCASRVQGFVSHSPPGFSGEREEQPDLALVHWYPHVPAGQASIDAALGCPVFGKKLIDNDPRGNLCLVQQFLPCQLADVPYQFMIRSQVAIISRFANFRQALP